MINLTVPQHPDGSAFEAPPRPNITIIGVGGAGGNAVNNMISDNLQGVEFMVVNTDAQALALSRTQRRLQLGMKTTQGLGAGARPEVGRAAAEENQEDIAKALEGTNMVFVTAGMGGGTGTGAAPVVARIAREMGLLTVGVVTKPFQFEGLHRMRQAESGIEDLEQYVDTLIIIPNQNLFRIANEKTTFADAFKMADNVLNQGVRSVTDLMTLPGLINLDFADVSTVMSGMGRAMMGTGEASGERRALDAAESAIANPLLEDTCMKGAKGVLINITGSMDITLFEVDEAANRIRDEVESEANIIFGSCFDPELEGKMRVSVVATGIYGAAANIKSTNSSLSSSRAVPLRPSGARPAPDVSSAAARRTATAPAQERPLAAAPNLPEPDAAAVRFSSVQPTVAERMAGQIDQDRNETSEQENQASAPLAQGYRNATIMRQAVRQPTLFDQEPTMQRSSPPPFVREDAFIPAPTIEQPELLSHRREASPAFAPPQPEPEPFAMEPTESETPPPDRPGGLFSLLRRSRASRSDGNAPSPQQKRPSPSDGPSSSMQLSAALEDRPAPIRHEEDELEIPAFLRRQAN